MKRKKNIVIYIPCYNAEKTIVEALKAITSSINFYGDAVPIIIYDDCSIDNSVSCINAYKYDGLDIKLYKNSVNAGERSTTNLAFDNLSKEYDWVFIMHADDIPKKEWVKEIYDVVESCDDSKVFTVWSSYDYVNEIDNKLIYGDSEGSVIQNKRSKKDANFTITNISSSWHISGSAINLKLFSNIGKFDVLMPQYGDTDFYARAILNGFQDIYIRKTLIYYRLSPGSVSTKSWGTNRDIQEIFYLSKKFQNVLSSTEQKKMFWYAVKTTFRRSLKYLIFGKWDAFLKTISMTASTVKKYISIK
jgi:glycosyltransferase involved in cell wall biosynthesis